jgi:hypothetical protein
MRSCRSAAYLDGVNMTDAQDANSELSAKRNQWLEWARKQIGGDEARIQAAAEAALRAALGGASSQEAAAAARAAVGLEGAGPVAVPPHAGGAPPVTVPPGTPPVSAGHDNAPVKRRAWYRRPAVLLAVAVVIVLLAGVLVWAISSQMSGPGAPATTSVVPSTSTTKQTTKRTRKPSTSTSESAGPNAVTIPIPSMSP